MVNSEVLIGREIKTVWTKIEDEFAKTFECKAEELLNRETTAQTKNYGGNPITITQKVTEYVPEQSITVISLNNDDIVSSKYSVSRASDTTTKVVLSVEGKNDKSVLKSWNYFLMGLPILRGGTKKKLRRQLYYLKNALENRGD